jgi:phosphotransferase system  glucose/maltose/N-acetylglucosamine-specific IIC component
MKNKSLLKHPYKFAIIGGVFWGLTLFFLTLIAIATGYGTTFLTLIGGIYPGYEISYTGAFVVLFFGFMDGFIFCYLIAIFNSARKNINKGAKNKIDKPK